MKTCKKVLGTIGGVLLALVLVLLVCTCISLLQNNTGGAKEVAGSADWMGRLADSVKINEAQLPGTHDSATQYAQLNFFSKCQGMSIGEQLEAGYRYLDIRLGEEDKSYSEDSQSVNQDSQSMDPAGAPLDKDHYPLKLMHGFTNCKTGWLPWSSNLYLDDVLSQCYMFLQEHPSESIVFVVKHEHGDLEDASFRSVLESYIAEHPEYWYLENRIPTVGEVRGKLILATRWDAEAIATENVDATGDGVSTANVDATTNEDATANVDAMANGKLAAAASAAFGLQLNWVNQPGHEDVSLHMEHNVNPACDLYVQDRYEYGNTDKWTAFCNAISAQKKINEETKVCINFLSTKGTLVYGHPYLHASKLNQYLLNKEWKSETSCGWVIVDFGNAGLAEQIYSRNF